MHIITRKRLLEFAEKHPDSRSALDNWYRMLDELIDEVGEDESHPLVSLMEALGTLIENYESQFIPEPEGDPIGSLTYLMEEHGLQASDLSEIGNEATVLNTLAGKKELTLLQVRLLAKRFRVSPAVFV